MVFKNVSGIPHNTIHRMDYGFWEELNQQIQDENIEGLNPDIRGLLATIGIEKGKEFAPDARMKKILTDAAAIAAVTARAFTARPEDDVITFIRRERMDKSLHRWTLRLPPRRRTTVRLADLHALLCDGHHPGDVSRERG